MDYYIEYVHSVIKSESPKEPMVTVDLTINSFGSTFRTVRELTLAEWNSVKVRGYIN